MMKETNIQNTTTAIDAVFARNIRTFAVLCVILAAAVGGTATAAKTDSQPDTQQSEKRKIIRSWQSYFRALHTLEYEWVLKGNTDPDAPTVQNTFRYAFLWNGRDFRLDTDISSTKKRKPYDDKSTILTYDGKFYRTLATTLSGTRRFDLIDPPAEPIGPMAYDTMLPVLSVFSFVFEEGKDIFALESLQKDDIWQRFEKRIANIKRGEWQGRQGRWLLVEEPEYMKQTKVFVDDANNFPLFVEATDQFQGEGEHDYVDVAGDSQVTQTMKWRAGSTTYVFPLRIVTRFWSKEVTDGSIKRTSAQVVQETTAPVKINQSLEAKRFHFDIPAGTKVWFSPWHNSKPSRPYPFVYDPKGGSLWAQEQRQRKRVAQEKQRIAALPKVYDEKADGKTQIEEALKKAKTNNKRVLLQFGANWCAPCHTLHDLFTKDSEIASILQQNFVVVNIDVNEGHNANVEKQYAGPDQGGLPFLVVLDADGKRLGPPPAENFDTSKVVDDTHFNPKTITAFLNQWKPNTKEN